MKLNTIVVAVVLSLPLPLYADDDSPSITVQGVAEERVPPDQLQLSLTIRSTGKELSEVATANRERAGEITKLLRDLKLGETEVTTGSASFGEHTEYKSGKRIKLGYVATTSIAVATGKLDLYDTLWFALSKFPDVSVNSASFALKDRSQVRAVARKKALQAAQAKAREMAAALGGRIGIPFNIVENPPQLGMSFSNLTSNSIAAVPSGEPEGGPLEPGLVSVTERVQVTFQLLK